MVGLLERCIEPTAPLSDLSVNLPRHLRGKIYVASKPLESQISPLEVEAEDCFSKAKPSTDLGLNRDLPYAPAILHMNDINKDRKPVPDATSLRIPGAIIADPHIRRCVDAAGMKASENAIWLLVVAVKEFTKHILENTLSAVQAVKAGHVPPRITTHPMSLAGKRHSPDFAKPNQDATIAALAKIITLNDLHAVTSNLPTSEQSLIGCVSRSTFEYGLFSSCDNDLSIGGRAFDDLKAYIVSSITPPEPKRMKVQAPHQKTQTASLTTSVRTVPDEPFMGRKSPPVRGLGRGAKDLAALKARAGTGATTPNSEIVSAEAAPNEDLSAAIKVETVHPMTVDRNALKSLGKQGRTAAKTSSTTAELPVDNAEGETVRQPVPDDKPKDKPKLSESTSEAMSDLSTHSAAQRRGKGHGVKSLAAMRARSTTSLYDGSDFPDGISTIGEAESEATQQRPSGEPPVAKSESLPAKSCDVSYATDILTESSKVTEKKSSMTAAASKTSEIILDQVALVEEATSGEATVLCNPEDFPSNQEADVRVALSAIEAKESQIERVEDLTAPQQTEPVGVDSDSAVALEESKQTLTTASLTSSANINDKGTVTAVTSMAKPMVTSFDIVSSLSKISQEEPSKDNDVTTENVADKSLPDDSIKCQAETEETKRTTSMLQSDQQSETKSSVGTETTTAPIETTEVVVAATPPLTEESAATTTTEVTAVSTAAVAESTKTTESTTIESSTIIPTPSTSGIVADELIPTTTTTIYQSEEEL